MRGLTEMVRHKPMPREYSEATRARFWAKVDKSGDCWKWTACTHQIGYGSFGISGSNYMAHRVAYEMKVGPIPDGMEIDHTCHNRGCVNPDHLRTVTRKQNIENPAKLTAANTSGVNGVHWYPKSRKWKAQIGHNKRKISIGYFDTIEEAAEAARAKRLELFTHNELDRKSVS